MEALAALMDRLREPGGCAWDRDQTYLSLTPYTIEEAYELVEAVEAGDFGELKEELGDLLFHVVFYARIAQEEGRFDLPGVIDDVVAKMIRRHPHVFGDDSAEAAGDVPPIWEEMKKREREAKRENGETAAPLSVFEGLSGKLPALLWAYKIQQKMAKTGFDWEEPGPVVGKVREELDELEEAMEEKEADAIEDEVGDVLLTMVNMARHLGVNPEKALRRSALKSKGRFEYIERKLHKTGTTPYKAAVDEMEAIWEESKKEFP